MSTGGNFVSLKKKLISAVIADDNYLRGVRPAPDTPALPGAFKTNYRAMDALRFGVPVTRALPRRIFRLGESRLSVGAGEGIRTLDPDLGKVVLYP